MLENPFADDELPEDPEEGEETSNPFEEFLSDAMEVPGIDPSQIVTIRSANGQGYSVIVEGPTPLSEVLRMSGLNFQEATEYWVNGSHVDKTMPVAPGAVVVATTVVKGG